MQSEYDRNRLAQMRAIAKGRSGERLTPEEVDLVLNQAALLLSIEQATTNG
jgi:hypothetical protein